MNGAFGGIREARIVQSDGLPVFQSPVQCPAPNGARLQFGGLTRQCCVARRARRPRALDQTAPISFSTSLAALNESNPAGIPQ